MQLKNCAALAHHDWIVLEGLFSHPVRRWLHCSADGMVKQLENDLLCQNSVFNFLFIEQNEKFQNEKEEDYQFKVSDKTDADDSVLKFQGGWEVLDLGSQRLFNHIICFLATSYPGRFQYNFL